ncbi:MAG: NADAR family protein [Eubacterium sp.]|nr:NADAR family protein [Eubacterium sp.]
MGYRFRKIGRNADGYIQKVWEGSRQVIVLQGLMAKFSQNEELKQKLMDTGEAWLVECAGSDRIWANGINIKDARRYYAEKWTGTNILGFALMEIRSRLKADQ